MSTIIATAVVALVVGILFGWLYAHRTIAIECERLGSFYVGKITYQCTAIKETNP
jgi:hypothetical protein